ncbi:MAG: head-tail connector protein [Treponema sp.]|jgi:hypothetical protein|nr:head-tail connector protein [Treponema sp.]
MDTDRELIEDIQNRLEYLRGERAKREADWNEVQRWVAPSVLKFGGTEKIPTRPKRFTSRPSNYLKTLVSGITGYSISPNILWQKLSLADTDLLDSYGVKDWLERAERALYAEFSRSNLYAQVPKLIGDAAAYGHGAMLIDEDVLNARLRFTALRLPEFYLDSNEYDEVETVFRYFTMTLQNAASFFGEEKLSRVTRQDYGDKKKRNNEISIIHAVYRRQDYDEEKQDRKNMPFASVYVEDGQDHLIEESGYHDFPYAVFIWDKIAGTGYGESPAIYALDDIRLLNKTEEARLKAAQLSAEPPVNAPDDMRPEVEVVPRMNKIAPNGIAPGGKAGRGRDLILPGLVNYYDTPDKVMTPVNVGMNFPVTIEITNSVEERIRDWFNVDFFLMLQHRGAGRDPMTATEVMELQGEKAAVLSDLVVNLNGALSRIIQRSFNILWRQGKIPPPPDVIARGGAKLKVDFIGPLAQAQKRFHETGGIGQSLQIAGAIGQIAPAALDVVDFDEMMKNGIEGAGISQLVIREDEDVAKIRQARIQAEAEARRQALAMEQQKNVLGNFNKLNEPLKPGTALEAIGSQMAGGGR